MNSLAKDKLGEVIQIQKSTIFKKEKPDIIQEANLEVYAVEKEMYEAQYWKAPLEEKRIEAMKKVLRICPDGDTILARLFPPTAEEDSN